MATVNTVHTLQLTTEEVRILASALRRDNEPVYYDCDQETVYPSEEAVDLEKLLSNIAF